MAELTDKELHCMARAQQSELLGKNVQCMYCKYAIQCLKEYKSTNKAPFVKVWKKLEGLTGVKICLHNPETQQKDILVGSWIENCPELLEQFTNISFEEQQDILQSPDILQYMDSRSFGN